MKHMLLIATALFVGACGAKSVNAEKSSAKKIPETFSLASLNDAANLLMSISDTGTPTPCNITPEQATSWMNPLHSMMDEEINKESEAALKNPKTWIAQNKIESCEARCECGLWVNVLDNSPKAMAQGKVDVIRKKAAKQSPEQLRKCAEAKGAWFCASPLKERLENASKH